MAKNGLITQIITTSQRLEFISLLSYFFLSYALLFLFMGRERLKVRDGGSFEEILFLLSGAECQVPNFQENLTWNSERWQLTRLSSVWPSWGNPGFGGVLQLVRTIDHQNKCPDKTFGMAEISHQEPNIHDHQLYSSHVGSSLETILNISPLICINSPVYKHGCKFFATLAWRWSWIFLFQPGWVLVT